MGKLPLFLVWICVGVKVIGICFALIFPWTEFKFQDKVQHLPACTPANQVLLHTILCGIGLVLGKAVHLPGRLKLKWTAFECESLKDLHWLNQGHSSLTPRLVMTQIKAESLSPLCMSPPNVMGGSRGSKRSRVGVSNCSLSDLQANHSRPALSSKAQLLACFLPCSPDRVLWAVPSTAQSSVRDDKNNQLPGCYSSSCWVYRLQARTESAGLWPSPDFRIVSLVEGFK